MPDGREDFITILAQQSYSIYLLVKTLRELGVLTSDPVRDRWNEDEFEQFLRDFRMNYFPGVL